MKTHPKPRNSKPAQNSVQPPPGPPLLIETQYSLNNEPVGVLGALAAAVADAQLVSNKLKALVGSATRHGDLQVALSAVRRIEGSLLVLIEAEEE